MPFMKYFGYVGSVLVILMIGIGWWFPQPQPDPVATDQERPAIRITSVENPPERVLIDTSLPTIVPPPSEHDAPSVIAMEPSQRKVADHSAGAALKPVIVEAKAKHLGNREAKKKAVANRRESALDITPPPQHRAAPDSMMSVFESLKERVGQLSLALERQAH